MPKMTSLLLSGLMGLLLPTLAVAQTATPGKTVEPLAQRSPLAVQVTTDKKTYKAGDPFTMTLKVKNVSRSTVPLTFGSGQTYDFEIFSGKKSLWKWSKGRVFTQALQTVSLEPGKILTYSETYKPGSADQPTLPDGTYILLATLTNVGEPKLPPAKTLLMVGTAVPPKPGAMTAEDALKAVPAIDPKYAALQKTMDDSEAALKKSPDDAKLKAAYVEATYDYGHTVMSEGQQQPRVMYRAALALFRRALAVDPKHQPSMDDKEMLEGIYKQMGMDVPQ